MRAPLTSFASARIGTQIAVLVVGALVLAHMAMTAVFLALHPIRTEPNSPFGAIERLTLVARLVTNFPSPFDACQWLVGQDEVIMCQPRSG